MKRDRAGSERERTEQELQATGVVDEWPVSRCAGGAVGGNDVRMQECFNREDTTGPEISSFSFLFHLVH